MRGKSIVLASLGANSPRLNKVGDACFSQTAACAEPEEKFRISLLCRTNPQEDDEASELTRGSSVRRSRVIRLDPETKAMLMALLAKDTEKAKQIIYECWHGGRISDEG